MEEGVAGRSRAEHVALSRTDAAACRATSRSRSARGSRRSFTPSGLARTLGLDRLLIKDESLNPTNSFKARGLSAAISRAKALRAETVFLPTAGNAGNAAAAYAAAAGMKCEVFIPEGRQAAVHRRVPALRRERHAGRRSHHRRRQGGDGNRQSRVAGTRSRRSARPAAPKARRRWAMSWRNSSIGRSPTGSFIRPAAAPASSACGRPSPKWKRSAGCRPGRRPKMVSVQTEGCAPIIRAFKNGAETAGTWENAHTVADGLRVPRAIADFLILRTIRESGGTAVVGQRPADGRRHDGDGPRGRHLGRARRRRVIERGASAGRRREPSRSTTPSCSSTPAAR